MFENEYYMNLRRYVKWICPSITKVRGFKFWVVLLALSLTALYFVKTRGMSMRWETLCAMLILCCVYRGFLFRPMYATKQFALMCKAYKKMDERGWTSRVVLDEEGVHTFMDEKAFGNIGWEKVESVTDTADYIDLEIEQDYVRLAKDSFTKGDGAGFLTWLDASHPEIPRKTEAPVL